MKNYLKAFLAVGAFLFASVGLADTTGEINSENFEGLTAGDLLNVSDAKDEDGNLLWESTENIVEDKLAVVTAYAEDEKRPSSDNKGGNNYLKIETGAPLYRKVFDLGGTETGNPKPISTGLYFEGDVQFSPYEEDVDTSTAKDDGTKLLVYIKGTEATDEAEAATNFVVVAGYYNGLNKVTTTNYVCKVPSGFNCNKDVWHHLLLKSYLTSDGAYSYFKVFVDGIALTNSEAKGADNSVMANIGHDAFPSIDATSTPTTLSGIGFKGTGKVDNLKWTTVDPAPTKVCKIYKWENGSLSLTVNGGDPTTVENGGKNYFNESDVLVATFTANPDYAFDETTDLNVSESTEDGITVTTYTYTPQAAGAVVTIEGEDTYVKDFVAAVELVNEQTGDVTLKLLTDATVVSTDSIVDQDGSILIGAENNTVTLILNEKDLSIAGLGLFANGGLIIVDKSQDTVTDNGSIITKNSSDTEGTIYAPTMVIYGGKFDARPSADEVMNEDGQETGSYKLTVADGYELPEEADSDGWYRLKKSGSSTDEPTIDGGDDNTKVDPETKTITVDSSDTGEITINGDASEYTISVPQNVTKITGSVGTITIMGKSEGMTTAVDITSAFKLDSTTTDGVTTIALDPDGKVTVNGVEVSVTPELDTTEGTEPFAVGDSVSATVKAIPGLTYQLLGATDLTTKTTKEWAGVGEAVTATDSGTVTLEDTSTEKPDAKFYVIKVSR